MKIFERVNIEKCKYLLSLKKYEFEEFFPRTEDDKINEKDFTFKNVAAYCKKSLLTGCNMEVEYSHSQLNPTSGRLFAKGGLQNMRKGVRKFLTEGIYRDWDMENAHPNIMLLACQERGFQCSELKKYCENRQAFLLQEGVGKRWMLELLNTDRPDWKIKDKSENVKNLAKELRINKKKLFDEFKTTYKYKEGRNPISSLVNAFWCDRENTYLQEVIKDLDRNKLGPLCFDGFMYDISDDLELPAPMKWAEKENKSHVEIPDDFVPTEPVEITVSYADKKREFEEELGLTKIKDPVCFILRRNGKSILYKKDQLSIAFENAVYEDKNKHGDIVEMPFIPKWLKDPEMQMKDEFGLFPDEESCPENIYNNWVPFDCTTWNLENYQYDQSKVDIYLKLLWTLCNEEENTYQFFVKWIAHIFQLPQHKPLVAIIISGEQGVGKDMALDALALIMGKNKRFESICPEREVWGQFNGQMRDCMLVQLSEIDKSNTRGAGGMIKSFITSPTINTNQKFEPACKMKSIHRYITTTNNAEPKTDEGKGQRRYVCTFAKSTYKNDSEFWTMYVNDILKNKNSLYSIYDYFKNKVEDVPETFSDKIEQYFSKFQLDMCDQNQPYHEAFLEYLLEAYLYSKDNTGAIDEDRFFQQVVDPNAIWCDENYTRLRSVRASFALQICEDHGNLLSISASAIYELFKNYLLMEKRLSLAAAQEYSMKNFCTKLTAMQSNYGIIKKRVSQRTRYHLRLDQLVEELNINRDLEE